jgi:adenylate cyclase
LDDETLVGPWIGLYQEPDGREPAGGWRWVTGEELDFTRWWPAALDNHTGDNDYGYFWGMTTTRALREPRHWDDGSDFTLRGFVMEVEPVADDGGAAPLR